MDTPSPQESPAYQALIGSVKLAELDTSALRNLLWLFNANPHLIAHAQVFKHLVAHFDSEIFLPRNLTWASAWKDEIPTWRLICQWIVENRRKLLLKPGLERFDRHLDQKHPHLFTGLGRHAIPASLWNQHSACKHYPPVLDFDAAAAHRYFELQSHLLASYAETRFRSGSRAIYEAHGGKFESAVAPSQVPTIGLAVRDLSQKVYSGWVELLPASDSTETFANDIVPFRFSNRQLCTADMKVTQGEADRHLAAIRRYFRNFTLVLSDQLPPKSQGSSGSRRMGGSGGGKEFRHGFINQIGPANVFLEEVPLPPSDPDFVEPPGQGFLVNLAPVAVESNPRKGKKPTASAAEATALALEASGLSPNETLEEVIRLYSPEDHKGRVREMFYQRLAAESRAQALPFDYSELTPSEINLVANHVRAWAQGDQTCMQPESINFSEIGGCITELMLSLGQTAQQAWSICSIWRTPSTPIELITPVRGRVTLVISAPQVGDWENASVDGFCMPGLRPTYRTDLPEGLAHVDAVSADCFILPDFFGTGQRVLQFMRRNSTPKLDGFGVSEETARESVKALCKSLPNSRITPEKIARVLPSLVTSLTGDQSLAWVLTADSRKANQTRMFYTRHGVERLQDTYRRAARHLAKTTGLPISATQKSVRIGQYPGVGTRFIPSMTEMRELVTSLRETIIDDLPEFPSSDFFMWYHNIYVVHTHLHQSLDTGLRAISAPNDLYRIAATSVTDFGNPAAALSDKDTVYSSKARLVIIRRGLRNQFMYLGKHLEFLESHIPSATLDIEHWRSRSPLFLFNRERRAEDLTPTAFEQALKYLTGYDLPANCHRAFLRYHMLDRGCAAEVVDAHFGHANFGESPFSRFSSFDYRLHLDQIDSVLEAIHVEIGLQPLKSQIAYKRLPGRKA